MRIWSIHPKYLDSKGLVALWRETLLAKNVIEGKTIGYKNHSQLLRFKTAKHPLDAINYYLHQVWIEANARGYHFNKSKYTIINKIDQIPVTNDQLAFERNHLLKKLKVRDPDKQKELLIVNNCKEHPLFKKIVGGIEPWEKT